MRTVLVEIIAVDVGGRAGAASVHAIAQALRFEDDGSVAGELDAEARGIVPGDGRSHVRGSVHALNDTLIAVTRA